MSMTTATPTVPKPNISRDFRDLLHEITPKLTLAQLRENKDIVLNTPGPSATPRSYSGHLWNYLTNYVIESPLRTKITQVGSLAILVLGYAAEQAALGYNSFGTQCQINDQKQCVPGGSPIPGYITGLVAGTAYLIVNALSNHLNIGSAFSTNIEVKEQQADTKLKMLQLRHLEHLDRWVTEKKREQAVQASQAFQLLDAKDLNAEKLAKYVSFIIKHAPDNVKSQFEHIEHIRPKDDQKKSEALNNSQEVVYEKGETPVIVSQLKQAEDPLVKKAEIQPTDHKKVPQLSPEPENEELKIRSSKEFLLPKEEAQKTVNLKISPEIKKEPASKERLVGTKNLIEDIQDSVLPLVSQVKQDLKTLVEEIKKPKEINPTPEGTTGLQKPKMDWRVEEGNRKSQRLPPQLELINKVDEMFSAIQNYLDLPFKPLFLEMNGVRIHPDCSYKILEEVSKIL